MKVSAEVASYLIKVDSTQRNYPLSNNEVEYQVETIRKNGSKYTFINGDTLQYKSKHWSIMTFTSYKQSLRELK